MGKRLRRSFFERYSPNVAKDLLGTILVRRVGGKRLSGSIVETEAYRGRRDPASHAYRGRTSRNEVMFGPAGHAYVYFTMGLHFCLNVTAEPGGGPGAVLIRAVRPLEGIEHMLQNRQVDEPLRLANGPANLTKAFQIDRSLNGEDMVTSLSLYFEEGNEPGKIASSARVGVTRGQNQRWRFYVDESPWVSKGKPSK